MTALDFMMGCIGTGVILVCVTWSFKLLSDTRARLQASRGAVQRKDEPLDPMGQRLQELRSSRFGRPMELPAAQAKVTSSTWPVMQPRIAPPLSPDDKRPKKIGKKQGGK